MIIFLGLKSITEICPDVKCDLWHSQAQRASLAQSMIKNTIK